MIDDPRGAIEFDEHGSGPTTLVFVPGSFSTGAAWRPVIRALAGHYRIVTTSLLGYGGTAERRDLDNLSIDTEVEVLAAVLRRVGGPAHVIGHSFGAHVALACALRTDNPPLSPAVLEVGGEPALLAQFHSMSDPYIAAWRAGEADAARRVIDWLVAYRDRPDTAAFARMAVPTQVLRGALGHAAVQRGNELIRQWLPAASLMTVPGASHFMISTHADEVARLVEAHIAAVSKCAAA